MFQILIYLPSLYISGQEKSSVGINPRIRGLPTAHKAVKNGIMRSWIVDDENGYIYIFMGKRYISTLLFSIMAHSWNIRSVETYKSNIKGYDGEALNLDKNFWH